MIIVYTGEGKGKTSACIGQAVRALGHDLDVVFAQFIKRDEVAGEQKILRRLLGDKFRAGGLGFVANGPVAKEAHAQKARELLAWAVNADAAMTILDEALYACNYGLLAWSELAVFADRAACRARHLVLSGRVPVAPIGEQTILDRADIVTVMRQHTHCFALGVPACEGIEY